MTVARRYAQALFEQADEQAGVDALDQDIALIRESLDGSPELRGFFESPIISAEKKSTIVDDLFSSRVSDLTLRFIKLLIQKKREELLPDMAASYQDLRDEQLGIIEAIARSADELGEQEKRQLTEALQQMTGKDIRLTVEIDPSLIGGLVVRVGDRVYDRSIEHQLETLRERMEEGQMSVNGAAQ